MTTTLVSDKDKKKDSEESAKIRPKAAFVYFANEKRPEMKKQYPDLTANEITAKLSEIWKVASAEVRQVCVCVT